MSKQESSDHTDRRAPLKALSPNPKRKTIEAQSTSPPRIAAASSSTHAAATVPEASRLRRSGAGVRRRRIEKGKNSI